MAKPLKCPQCGAAEANLLQDNIYQCKFCGSIYEYGDTQPVFEDTHTKYKPVTFDTQGTTDAAKKIMRSIVWFAVITTVGIAGAVFFITKKNVNAYKSDKPFATAKNLYSKLNESTYFFNVVNTKKGPQVWTISRVNSDRLTEVNYYLNQIDVKENKLVQSQQLGSTITWKQSMEDAYRMGALKQIDKICWLIYGDKLIGYDVDNGAETMNNAVLSRQFQELRKGIAKVENTYDMDGFKLTTKDGYIYYYEAALNKLFTEEQYEDKSKTETEFIDRIEYAFTDGERQQLYRISRKTGKIFYSKLQSYTLSSIVKDNSDWYKRSYKINSLEEFTPGKIYFKASVLYFDKDRIVLIYQDELGESSPVIVKCLDVNKNELWTKTGEDTKIFKPFLKSTNAESFLANSELTIIQPYQIAICLDVVNGKINWSFKPY